MGCASCSVTKNGVPQGCGNKGHCTSGSCNKKNSFDWLATLDLHDPMEYRIVEISFKKGVRKAFFINPSYTGAETGDLVVVESSNGYDIGRISLSGDLVRLQMKKKKKQEESIIHKVIRIANHRDIEKLNEARDLEKRSMIKARQIARDLGIVMKIGEVEYQGDKRKATFYYTAEGRVDFRELVRMFAKEFKIKIEMKQIGSRQESSIIGGIGTCGRELCCSTWKSTFETVTTTAARYQNLAINQTKLTGQCGRLKCCLNYELDTYMDALGDFPENADNLLLENGKATLVKTDIFKKIMYYSVQKDNIRGPLIALTVEKVKKIQDLIKKGVRIDSFEDVKVETKKKAEEDIDIDNIELDFADVTGEIELPDTRRRKKRRKKRPQHKNQRSSNKRPEQKRDSNKQNNKKTSQDKTNSPKSQSEQKPNPNKGRSKNKKRNFRKKPRNNSNQTNSNDKKE